MAKTDGETRNTAMKAPDIGNPRADTRDSERPASFQSHLEDQGLAGDRLLELDDIKTAARKAQEAAKKLADEAKQAEKAEKIAEKKAEKWAQEKAKQERKNTGQAVPIGVAAFRKLAGRPLLVTLYIDDTGIRLLAAQGNKVTSWAAVPLDPGLVTRGVVNNPDKVGAKINELFLVQGITNRKRVVVGVSGLNCLSRVMTLPVLPRALVDEAVRREAERELPMSLDSLYLSYQVFHSSSDEIRVFLVAYNRDRLDSLVKTLRRAKIKPWMVDLAPLALTRAVNSDSALILGVRSSEADIVVTAKGVPELIRTLPLQPEQSLGDRMHQIKEELRRTLNFYYSNAKEGATRPRLTIFASGEAVTDREFFESVANELSHEVLIPAPAFDFPREVAPAQYMVNVGLLLKNPAGAGSNGDSLIDLNVLPEIYRPRKLSMASAIKVPSGLMGIALLAALAFYAQQASAVNADLREQIDNMSEGAAGSETRITTLRSQIRGTETRLTAALKAQNNVVEAQNTLIRQKENITVDLQLINSILTADTVLNRVELRNNTFSLTGNAADERRVLSYASDLRASDRFSNVAISSLKTKPTSVEFSLVAKTRAGG